MGALYSGDSNTEIVDARKPESGTAFPTLKDRLDNSDELLATKPSRIELNNKADKGYVDSQISSVEIQLSGLDDKIDRAASGAPKGAYATLLALQVAFPTGNSNIYVVTADGKWYYWNGTAWTAGGVYQSTGFADGSVNPAKTTFFNEIISTNIFNESTITTPGIVAGYDGTIITSGIAVDYLASDYISVTTSKTYYTTLSYDGAWYDSSKNYISGFSGEAAERVLSPPSNAAYMRITFALVDKNTAMVAADSLPTSYQPYGGSTLSFKKQQYASDIAKQINPYITTVSKWTKKKWNAIGDSITEHNDKTTKNYQDYIAEKIGCSVNNYGISGTGWRTPSAAGATNAFYQRITSLASDADLITVFGGTNDWSEVGVTFVLGSFGDTDPAASFYGAVNNVITQLINKYPTKTIAVFTPLPRDNNWSANSAGITLEQIADAIIKVCNHYSVPILDLYRDSNVYAWNTEYRSYALPDGLHPNDNGHRQLADKILSFLNNL